MPAPPRETAKPKPVEPEIVAPKLEVPAATAVAERLARQLRLTRDQVEIAQVTTANWPNSCLGLPAEGEICAMMITPGYAVSLAVAGQRYEYRTDESGQRIRLASAPRVEAGEALLTWRDSQSFSVLVVGTENVAFGRRGGPMLTVPLTNPDRAGELMVFLGTFAPMQKQTAAGEVVLRSVGTSASSPAQQRMIAEWARIVRQEAETGMPQPDAERLLVWERVGGIAGFCDQVVFSRTGKAVAYDCSAGTPQLVASTSLEPEELAEMYSWMDHYGPFYWESGTAGAVADGMNITIDFKGSGVETLTDARGGELLAFVNRVVDRLMAATPDN